MTKPECPIPAIEDALMPYVHTREKTARIRQILTQHIRTHVKDDTELTHVSLSLPPSSLQSSSASIPVEGIYRQYLQALHAHRRARERYDTAKDDLDQLLHKNAENESNSQESISRDSAREYAGLLRHRRQQRKLEIVQDALTKLLDVEPNPASLDIKVSVREMLGEPPQHPVAIFEGGSDADAKVRDLTFQLKKELLVAKNKLSEAKAAKEAAQNQATNGSMDVDEKISILRDARDELISWVEGELAKIPEDEVEASQAEISFIGDDDNGETNGAHAPLSNQELSKRVEELYSQYVNSRQRYITELEAALEHTPRLGAAKDTKSAAALGHTARRQTQSSSDLNHTSIQASQLLPYLTATAATTRDEALLQQQTSHLRRQLILSSDETNNIIQRLAGESLLVPQDSTTISAWAKAAGETSEKTRSTVLEQVIEGEASVAQAKRVLEGLRARKKALEGLRRDL